MIHPAVKEDVQKFCTLFSRATFSQLAREKNMLIREIQNCYNELDQKFNNQISINQSKSEELGRLTDNYNDISAKLADTKYKKAIIKEISTKSNHDYDDYLRASIKKLDDEITHYDEEYMRAENSDKDTTISLIDINLKKLEDLVYALRKRYLIVEQGNEVTDQINADFGSIPNLLETYKRLKAETEKRIDRERQTTGDSIIKRRKMSQVTNTASRNIAIFFQKDLECQTNCQNILKKMEKQIPLKPIPKFDSCLIDVKEKEEAIKHPQIIDFDNLVNDQEFKKFFTDDNTKSMNDILVDIQKSIKEAEEDFNHVNQANTEARGTGKSGRRGLSIQTDRLEQMRQNLLQRYTSQRDQIDQLTTEIEDLCNQLLKTAEERNNYEIQYSKLFWPTEKLLEQYLECRKDLYLNTNISQLLFYISSTFALEIQYHARNLLRDYHQTLHHQRSREIFELKSPQTHLGSKLQKTMSTRRIVKPIQSGSPLAKNRSKTKERFNSSALGVPSPTASPAIERKDNVSNPLITPPLSPQLSLVEKERRCLLEDMKALNSDEELYYFFATRYLGHIGGYLFDQKVDLTPLIQESRIDILSSIEKIAKECLDEQKAYRNSKIGQLRQLTNFILVKEKESIEIQTEKLPLREVEVMTDPPKKKGK